MGPVRLWDLFDYGTRSTMVPGRLLDLVNYGARSTMGTDRLWVRIDLLNGPDRYRSEQIVYSTDTSQSAE
jgi:hypothetical protein